MNDTWAIALSAIIFLVGSWVVFIKLPGYLWRYIKYKLPSKPRRIKHKVVQIVGEKYYESNIKKLVGERSDDDTDSVYICGSVDLLSEPENTYDRHAVRVFLCGKLVGYLDRENAARYSAWGDDGTVHGNELSANIKGGRLLDDGSRANYAVELIIPESNVLFDVLEG